MTLTLGENLQPKRSLTPLIVLCTLFTGLAQNAHARICNATTSTRHDLDLQAGYSPTSSTWIGTATDRKFATAGLLYSYTCWTIGAADIGYTVGVLPLTFLFQPAQRNYRSPIPPVNPAHAVYSAGVLPVGFTTHFGRHRVQPFFATHGGIIASTEPIPINATDATGLNFLFDFSPGVRINFARHEALNVGYKFLHISNAYTTNFNPGVDNNVIFVGFSLLR